MPGQDRCQYPDQTQARPSGDRTQGHGHQQERLREVAGQVLVAGEDAGRGHAEGCALPGSCGVIDLQPQPAVQPADTALDGLVPPIHGRCQLQLTSEQPPLLPSPGTPTGLEDPATGEIYDDTDPGNGDGRNDDCIGRLVDNPFGGGAPVGGLPVFDGFLVRPDGFPDAYLMNPGWGEVKVLASVNIATGMGGIWLYAGSAEGLQRDPDCF